MIEDWTAHLANLLIAAGTAVALSLLALDPSSPLRRRWATYVAGLDAELTFIRAKLSGRQLGGLQIISCLGLGVASVLSEMWLLLAVAVPLCTAPSLLLSRARTKRVSRVDEQLNTWLIALSNALKSGTSLGEAIGSSARLVRPPIREELELALTQYHLGSPLDEALGDLSDRLRSRAVTGAVVTLRIARNTGGDLPKTLELAAATLREMARLEGVVRTKTAEGKAQAFVVSMIPAPLFGGIEWMSPGFLSPLTHSFKGYLVIAAAAVLWIAAIALAAKITRVDL